MASAFGHSIAALAIGASAPVKQSGLQFWVLGIVCSIIPDADVIAFQFRIPYDSLFGHRGITHSFCFAIILSLIVVRFFYSGFRFLSKEWLIFFIYFFLCTASHPILDAMTTGGRGVAFFAPFDNSRYFLPWRPIRVSPLSISSFLGERGWMVIRSEVTWIGIPGAVIISLSWLFRRKQ